MATCVDVPKQQKKRVLTARLDPREQMRIAALIKAAGSSQDQFLKDAIYEKLQRGGIERTDVGVLHDLDTDDRDAVQWIADVLRDQAGNTLLREVLAAQRGVLQLILK
jgi:hypothetical protein